MIYDSEVRVVATSIVVVAACGRFSFDEGGDASAGSDALAIDYCSRIPMLAAPVVIDGVLEAGLSPQRLVPVGWLPSVSGSTAAMPPIETSFAVGWRLDGVYFFIDVRDPDRHPPPLSVLPYCGDGVEVYVDSDGAYPAAPSYDAPGARQLIARAPQTDNMPEAGGAIWLVNMQNGPWTTGFTAYPQVGGYSFEAFIDAAALGLATWSLASGGRVGIDLSINASTPDGSPVPIPDCNPNLRLGQFFLRFDESYPTIREGAPFTVPTAFCTATLE